MPPSYVKTIRQQIFYQYAKIIADSSGFGKTNYGMITDRWKKLCSGEIHWSSTVREWLREKENPSACIYCGEAKDLTVEHILPRSCGGEDIPDNVVMVCKSCNSSKGVSAFMNGVDSKQRITTTASLRANISNTYIRCTRSEEYSK